MLLGHLPGKHCRPHRTVGVFILVLALLLAQTLALLHGVLHSPLPLSGSGQFMPLAGEHKHRQDQPGGHVGVAKHSGQGMFANLFSEHLTDTDCRIYDQLCHADALDDFAAPLLPLPLLSFALAIRDGLAKIRWHAQYQARGPPSPR